MEKITYEPIEAPAAHPATPWPETTSVSGCSPSSTPPPSARLVDEVPLTPEVSPAQTTPAAPTPSRVEQATVSVSGNRRQTAAIIADLQQQDIATVEAAMESVKIAYLRGDRQVIEIALLEQAAVLQALGITLLKVAGNEKILVRIQTFTNLSLRAMDQARKSLGALAGMSDASKQQTNVQVNVGSRTNELLPKPHG